MAARFLTLLAILLLGAQVALVEGHPGMARAGPSGTLVAPAGGTDILNLGNGGAIYVEYQRAVGGSTTDGSYYETLGIDLSVHNPDGSQADAMIVTGYKANPPTNGSIVGYFIPPGDACGTYQLVVTETQLIYQTTISFQSAAPTISIECGPIQKK